MNIGRLALALGLAGTFVGTAQAESWVLWSEVEAIDKGFHLTAGLTPLRVYDSKQDCWMGLAKSVREEIERSESKGDKAEGAGVAGRATVISHTARAEVKGRTYVTNYSCWPRE